MLASASASGCLGDPQGKADEKKWRSCATPTFRMHEPKQLPLLAFLEKHQGGQRSAEPAVAPLPRLNCSVKISGTVTV